MLSRNDQFGGLSTEKALLRPSINQSPNMTRSGLEGTGNSASLIKLKKEIDEIKAIVVSDRIEIRELIFYYETLDTTGYSSIDT